LDKQLGMLLQVLRLEFHVNAKGLVTQRGAGVIRKTNSAVYTAIGTIMIVGTYQV
jgi:hypothetical protein